MAHSPDVSLEPVVDSDFTPPKTPFGPDPTRWRALGVIAIAQLMVVLDASIVNLALPSAKAALGITDANQQWVITAYTLTFGGLLLLGGRIADYVGRKRAFIIGLIGFATASALGGLAPSQGFLFAARGLQGAFAALLAPAALSLLTVTFHEPKERARAFGVYGAISGGGAAIGLLLGGVLTEYLSWRWCLLVNAPIAIAAVFMAIPWVHESKAEGDTRYDVAGAVTATLGLVSLVYGFTKAAPKGLQDSAHWTDAGTLVWFAAAAILLTSFFVIENRVSNPLLPMRVLLDRNRGASYLVSLITGIGLFAMFLFLGLYLQVILHYSPVKAGFAFLPFSLGIILGAGASSQLLPRVGPKPLLVPGLIAGSVGLLLLTRLTPHSSYATPRARAHAHHQRRHGVRVHPGLLDGAARDRSPRRRCGQRDDQHLPAGRRVPGHRAAEHRGRHHVRRVPDRARGAGAGGDPRCPHGGVHPGVRGRGGLPSHGGGRGAVHAQGRQGGCTRGRRPDARRVTAFRVPAVCSECGIR